MLSTSKIIATTHKNYYSPSRSQDTYLTSHTPSKKSQIGQIATASQNPTPKTNSKPSQESEIFRISTIIYQPVCQKDKPQNSPETITPKINKRCNCPQSRSASPAASPKANSVQNNPNGIHKKVTSPSTTPTINL